LEFQPASKSRNGPDTLVEARFYIPGNVTQGQISTDGDMSFMKTKAQLQRDNEENEDNEQGEISAQAQEVNFC
jgi:hypothetical protein